MKTMFGAVLGMLALAAGCQSTPSASSAGAAGAAAQHHSGFLGDYSQLKPAPGHEGVEIFIDRSMDYRPFTKLMIDPVQIVVTPGPDQQQAPPEALARMSGNFRESLRRALEPDYQLVTAPGPDVLHVRPAITGVQTVKPAAGVTDYLPLKAIYNVGREAAGGAPRVAEMTAEMEILDPAGKRVVAATATRRGDKTLPQGEQVTWGSLQSISDYWAKSFRQRLDELRSAAPAPRQ